MRARHAILLISIASFCGCQQGLPTANVSQQPAVAQQSPAFVTVPYLSQHPLIFDGHLVRIRAWLAMGWEGDNFLFDDSALPDRNTLLHGPAVWVYSKRDLGPLVYGEPPPGSQCVLATFTGYFHFVPDPKSRIHDVFDPGPLQLEIIHVSELDPLSQLLNGSF